MLKNTFFYFFQTIMIFIQGLLGILQIQIICRINPPRQTKHCLQIIQLHTIIRRLWMRTSQFSQFFQENRLYFLTPFHPIRLISHFFYFLFLTTATQFVLNGLDLLLQEIFTLLLINIFTGTHLNRCFNFSQLYLPIQYFQQTVCTFS